MTPGIELSRAFWHDRVQPVVAPIADVGAALIGPGSEVLGFDDDVSTDHDYGPRLHLMVTADAVASISALERALAEGLPETFAGLPVRYRMTADPVLRHRVSVTTVADCFEAFCGIDPTGSITDEQWLRTPTQLLASLTDGAVFADPNGAIDAARRALTWYPESIWHYTLACQWRRIAQEEPFMARASDAADDLGARFIAGRLVGDLVRLAFLIERTWAPYNKWLSRAFGRLAVGATAGPDLHDLLAANSAAARQQAYLAAAATLGQACNALGLAPSLDVTPRPFHSRDILVLDAQRFADALIPPDALARWGWRGAIDQWVDNTDVLTSSG